MWPEPGESPFRTLMLTMQTKDDGKCPGFLPLLLLFVPIYSWTHALRDTRVSRLSCVMRLCFFARPWRCFKAEYEGSGGVGPSQRDILLRASPAILSHSNSIDHPEGDREPCIRIKRPGDACRTKLCVISMICRNSHPVSITSLAHRRCKHTHTQQVRLWGMLLEAAAVHKSLILMAMIKAWHREENMIGVDTGRHYNASRYTSARKGCCIWFALVCFYFCVYVL